MRRVEKQTGLDRYKMPSWIKPDFVRSIGSSRLELSAYKDAERRIFATRCPGHTDGSGAPLGYGNGGFGRRSAQYAEKLRTITGIRATGHDETWSEMR